MVQEGGLAPDFVGKDAEGKLLKLSDFRGQKVVLYFYPKDNTPGWTKQACSLRDSKTDLNKANIKVIGVSTDNEKSHQKFINKFNLPFTLIADTDHQISDLYGVYGEKSLYGKKYFGINRTTFLIDEKGQIVKILKKVNVESHGEEVLKAFSESTSPREQ